MRERDLDEFSSLFQRSIIPTIEVARIEIRDIVVIADFDERSVAGGTIAAMRKVVPTPAAAPSMAKSKIGELMPVSKCVPVMPA